MADTWQTHGRHRADTATHGKYMVDKADIWQTWQTYGRDMADIAEKW